MAPIYYNYLPEDGFEFNKITLVYIFTSLIAIFWLIKISKEKKIVLVKNILLILALAFVILNLASLAQSIHLYSSLWGNSYRFNGGFISLINYVVLFFVFIETFHDDKNAFYEIWGSILISSAFVSAYGLYQIIKIHSLDARIISTFGQPNYLGAYLALVIPANIFFILKEKDGIKKIGLIFLLLLNVFILFATESRSAYLAVFAALMLMAALNYKGFIKKKKKTILLILVLIFLAMLPFYKQMQYRVNKQVFTEIKNQEVTTGSFSLRMFAWKGAWQVFLHNPILGTGPETMMFSIPKYMDAKINNHIEWGYKFDKAHNEFLDILANTGILSLTIFLLILFFAFKKSFFNKEKDEKNQLLGIVLLSLILTNLFGFSCVVIALYFWLILALLVTQEKSVAKEVKLSTKVFFLFFFFIFLFFCFFVFCWSKIYLANIYFKKGDLENAVKYNPNIDRYHGELALRYLQNNQNIEAISEAEKSIQSNALNADNYRVLAMVMANIDQNKTLSALDKAIELEPTNPKIYLEKAKYLIKINDIEKAKEMLQKTLDLKPNYEEAKTILESIK